MKNKVEECLELMGEYDSITPKDLKKQFDEQVKYLKKKGCTGEFLMVMKDCSGQYDDKCVYLCIRDETDAEEKARLDQEAHWAANRKQADLNTYERLKKQFEDEGKN